MHADNARAGRGSIRAEQKRLTRERLVGAARTVFASKGYGAASIGDITAAGEVHRATFYIHFPDKAECFLAVLDGVIAESTDYWRGLDKALLEATPAAIRDWLAGAVHWWEEHADLLPAWEEALAVDRQIAGRLNSQLDGLATEMHGYLEQFDAGQAREDARMRIVHLILMLDSFWFRAVVQRVDDRDPERVLDLLADMWCGALRIVG
ncbi:TetR/AcrR family transcriptional regulator [Mycobacterium sp. NPDC051198]